MRRGGEQRPQHGQSPRRAEAEPETLRRRFGRLRRTLYWRLSLTLIGLLTALSLLLLSLCAYFWLKIGDVSVQALQWSVAERISLRLAPIVARDRWTLWDLQGAVGDYQEAFRGIDVYLLDRSGKVVADFRGRGLARDVAVRLGPIAAFLGAGSPPRLPVYGDDPSNPGRLGVISAAPLRLNGEPGYVYVLLSNTWRHHVRSILAEGAVTFVGVLAYFSVHVLVVAVGLYVFRVLTRRIGRMTSAVHRFRDGRLDERFPVEGSDDLGVLALALNDMAEAIERSVRELAYKDQLRRELIANVSHDLRGPLTVISGFAEIVVDRGDSLPAQERGEYCESILRGTRSLARLLSALLELTKLEAKEVAPDLQPLDLDTLVDDLVRSCRGRAAGTGISLTCSIEDGLPKVSADIGMIERVLMNLIENALRYTASGGSVCVSLARRGQNVEVAVSDTGIGIPEQEIGSIFERQHQVEGEGRENGLGGLGLAIVQKLVEVHGGRIAVQSRENQGTTFSFSLKIHSD